jgi:UDP-4-amino-4-deoxy-L-arabinose-oxoglutarate aminotransferase
MSDPQFIPFCRPTLEEEEIASVVDSLKSGWITTGPKVLRFEEMWRERLGVPHAVALNSATAGLHVALAGLDVGPGDEVITTSMTWPSTLNVTELLGAKSVFAEVLPGTLLIDPADVARKLTPRTKAVIPVHHAGAPADLDALAKVIAGSKAVLIEDAAHAAGTKYKGRETGSEAYTAIFSFHPIKNITTGEGGVVTTRDDALAARMKRLRWHGVGKDSWARYGKNATPRYEVVEPGWKYNMLDLQAALGCEQLKKLERFNAVRTQLAANYDRLLSGVSELRPLARPAYDHVHAWHLYIVQLELEALDIDRDAFIGELAARGIGAGLHFTPVHMHAYYREKYGFKPGYLPVTEAAGERILSLPLYPLLSPEQQQRVVTAIKDVVLAHKPIRVA